MLSTAKWRLSSPTSIAATLALASVLLVIAHIIEKEYDDTDGKDNDDNRSGNITKSGISGSDADKPPNKKSAIPSHLKREIYKEKRRQEKIPILAMKSPMYDNVKMLDQQNNHLANISLKKANWYISKDLAEWITTPTAPISPDTNTTTTTTIRLLFEPRARSNENSPEAVFTKSQKQNRCVVCGVDDGHYMRHYIVPSSYRSLFPLRYKSHLSHDVVITCPDCHVHCERESQLRANDLNEMAIPPEKRSRKYEDDKKLYQVRSSALALKRYREKIPEEKVLYHEGIVRRYFGLEDGVVLTREVLERAADLEYRVANREYVSGPEIIVAEFGEDEEKIGRFVKGWRRHFLDTAQPQFLPDGWSVDSAVSCGREDY